MGPYASGNEICLETLLVGEIYGSPLRTNSGRKLGLRDSYQGIADSATEPRNPETGAALYVVENLRR